MFPFEQRLTEEEKKALVSTYKTLEEGYVVLYLEAEFRKRGYHVIHSKPMNSFTLPSGKRKTFDMVLECGKTKETSLVDVDMGHLSEDDFHNILDKTYVLTSNLYLAAKDEATLYNTTKKYSFRWLQKRFGSVDKAKGLVTLHFTTLEWLILGEKEWEVVAI